MGCLYQLNFPNGKSYIGITAGTAEKRFAQHARAAITGRLAVHKAWRALGAPTLRVLAVLEDRELAATEIRAIAAYGTLAPNGYNLSFGGELSPMLNPNVAAKVSLANKGKPGSFIGRSHTAASNEKNRLAKLGGKLSDEHKKKISAAGVGRKPSVATRLKLSLALLGKPKSLAHRAKLAAVNLKPALASVERQALPVKAVNGRVLYDACANGHLLEGPNLRTVQEGKYLKRRCVECGRLRQQKRRAANASGIFALEGIAR